MKKSIATHHLTQIQIILKHRMPVLYYEVLIKVQLVSTGCLMCLVLTCPPEHGVVEERELHLGVVLQRCPASRCCHVDVGHVERNLHCQERLS